MALLTNTQNLLEPNLTSMYGTRTTQTPAPTATAPTSPNLWDWSSLPYFGATPNYGGPGGFDSGSFQDPSAPTYANVQFPGMTGFNPTLPNYSYQNTFGGHAGVIQNPDGTFTAQRRVQNNPDTTAYEKTQYQLSPDGKSLVPVNGQWDPFTIKDQSAWSGLMSGLKDAAPVFLPALTLGALSAMGVGAGAGSAGAAAAGSTPLNPALIESLANTAGYGASSVGAGLNAAGTIASGAGVADLASQLAPFTATPASSAPLALTPAAPAAGALPTMSSLPSLGTLGQAAGAAGAVASAVNGANATNPALIDSAAGTPGYGASSANMGAPGGSIAQGGLGMTGNQTAIYDAIIKQTGDAGLAKTISDLAGGASSTVGGSTNTIDQLLKAFGIGGSTQSPLAGLFGNFAGAWSANQARNNMKAIEDKMLGMYSPDSPYAQNMRQELDRRDAAAGRRSQYGPRSVELQAKLADSTQRALATIYGMQDKDAMYRNQIANNVLQGGQNLAGIGQLVDLFKGIPDWLNNLGGG